MLAIQTRRKRKRTEFEKDIVTKRDKVRTALREKYISSTITVSFSAAICSLARLRTPKPQAHIGIKIEEEKFKCHELRWSGHLPAIIRLPKLPPVNFFPFLRSGYEIWLSFWVFWLDRYRFIYLLWCFGIFCYGL